MARRADGGVRFRPVDKNRRTVSPTYSPKGIGCPAIGRAVDSLYHAQNEESFWALMSAVNYALELETRVLVPLDTALVLHTAPAPWVEHPVPSEKADGLRLWTLRNDKGQNWLPLFTATTTACADRSTSARPMTERTLQQAMEIALATDGINGVVIDPWGHSASLDNALLRGLLHASHEPDDPGEEALECGQAAARDQDWHTAIDCFFEAAEKGSSAGLTMLGHCYYEGHGVRKDRAEARRMWKTAADGGDPMAMLALGDDLYERQNNGGALLHYRRAQKCAALIPDIQHTPYILLRMAQAETRYTDPKKALEMAVEAQRGFGILFRDGEPDAGLWLQDAEALIRELNGLPAPKNAYNTDSLQLD